jgi:hypothetical protein
MIEVAMSKPAGWDRNSKPVAMPRFSRLTAVLLIMNQRKATSEATTTT